jgi:Na+/melibiose symporter-like transporter
MKTFFLFDKKSRGDGYLPNNVVFTYAASMAGQNLTYFYITNWLKYFFINVLKVDELRISSVFSASYIWDAINDPLVGAYIDKRKYKPYRKLRPFLLYTPPVIGILSVLMFINTGNMSETGKLVYLVLIYFLWDFFYTFQDVGLWGMVALSSPHSDERGRVSQWVSIGAGAGSAIVGVFQQLRTMMTGAGLKDAQIFFIFAVVFGLCGELISMNAYRVHECVAADDKKEESFLQSIAVLRHNPKLLLICLARFAQAFSPKVQNAYFFENCTGYKVGNVEISGQSSEFLYGLLGGIPGTFATFFATKIADRIGGMKRVLVVSQVTAIVIRAATYFVGYNTFAKFIIMTLLISLVNLPGSLMDIAHRSLITDSIDETELKTGLRTEGISFSMQNFTTKMQNSATTMIEGILLKKLGYNKEAKAAGLPQSEHFIKWQWPMFVLGPAVGSVFYLIIILFIKDDKQTKLETERKLKAMREERAKTQA